MKTLHRYLLAILLFDALVMGFVFSVSGFYNFNVDAKDYIAQVEAFAGTDIENGEQTARREFKPLYGVLGGSFVMLLGIEAETSVVVLNILFLIGLSYTFFFFLKQLDIENLPAFIGVLWLISGYPMLKYGLSIGTDISGWFFAAISSLIGLYGLRQNKIKFLIAASVLGFIGFLAKETGLLGLGLVGITLLFGLKKATFFDVVRKGLALCAPFLILEALFMVYLFEQNTATFFDWYTINRDGIHSFQTLYYFLFVELATFHVLLLFAAVGFVAAIRNIELFSWSWISRYAPAFLATLPIIVWPMYISRITYIQYLFMIPLALYGSGHLQTIFLKNWLSRPIKIVFFASVPIVTSASLFIVSKGGSLFEVFFK